ncbi:MAG TPA: PaaI family thioesterase, partial [Gaiellaceae bacterium]|nr:PaaI family thioesterase [Gaiellaceae bacterium]
NPIGSVHGGVALTLLDSAMGCAVHTLLEAGVGYATLEVKANFVRPITSETGLVRCEGTVLHAGSRVATAEGRVVDAAGTLLAHGTTTCLIIR